MYDTQIVLTRNNPAVMKVRLFMIVFKNYSRLGAGMHAANHPEGDTPRDHPVPWHAHEGW